MTIFLKKNKGYSLIEVLIACSIISVSIFAVMSASAKGIQISNQLLRQNQANFLLEEGAESVKSIRNDSWTNISSLNNNTNYYLSFNTTTNKWELSTTVVSPIDSIFTRTVIFSPVYRDASDDISSTGTLDSRTKEVMVTVSWTRSDSVVVYKDLGFYISDIFN